MSLKVNRNGNFQVGNTASGGSPASGTIEITENGIYDVTAFAEADVQTPVPSGKITISENGSDIDVSDYALADVQTPQPSGKITITENGTDIDVSSYATADVDVEQGILVDEEYTVESGTLTAVTFTASDVFTANIPDGVTTINAGTFSGNQYIQKVIMSDTVTTIANGNPYPPQGAFMECSNLYDIVFSDNLTSLGNFAFYKCTNIHSINLPNSLTNIGRSCFNDCFNLETVNFPSNITSIPDNCFNNCIRLGNSEVFDLRNIETIGTSSFENTGIVGVILSTELTSIGSGAFIGCQYLENIYYTGTQSEWEQITGLSDASIPSGCTIHYEYTPS